MHEGRFAEAITALTAAYRLIPKPEILYNIATAYQEVGDFEKALQSYEEFLKSGSPDQSLLYETRARIEHMKAEIELRKKPKVVLVPVEEPARPRWRLGVGAGLAALGVLTLGFGIPALAIDGSCIDPVANAACPALYDTRTLGIALTAVGAGLSIAGVVTMAWPPPRSRSAQPAASGGASRLRLVLGGSAP